VPERLPRQRLGVGQLIGVRSGAGGDDELVGTLEDRQLADRGTEVLPTGTLANALDGCQRDPLSQLGDQLRLVSGVRLLGSLLILVGF